MDEADKIWRDALGEFGQAVVERAQRNLGAERMVKGKKRRSVATGNLKDSLSFMRVPINAPTNVVFFAKGSAAKYADVVEKGRRPGRRMPPPDAIARWMEVKRIRPRSKSGGFEKSTPAKRKSMAFLIARSIGKKGIPGTFYFSDALRDELEASGQKLADAFAKTAAAQIELRNVAAK
jgi:hypothetical protein